MATDDPLQVPESVAEKDVDALYARPLDEFVGERDALAGRLRGEDRQAADWVKGLRKPTVAAWAINRVVRRERGKLTALLESASALQKAQEELTGGGGDAETLRKRSRDEDAAVAELTEAAGDLLDEEGRGASQQIVEHVRETLHAVSLDEEARRLVESGRLTHELRAVGLGPLPAAGGQRKRKGGKAQKDGKAEKDGKATRQAEKRLRRAEEEVEAASERQQEAERAVKEARRQREAAQRGLDAAAREEKQSRDRLQRARKKLEERRQGLRAG